MPELLLSPEIEELLAKADAHETHAAAEKCDGATIDEIHESLGDYQAVVDQIGELATRDDIAAIGPEVERLATRIHQLEIVAIMGMERLDPKNKTIYSLLAIKATGALSTYRSTILGAIHRHLELTR